MPAFPLFVHLEGKKCLIFGGGQVALRKVRTLLKFGAYIMISAFQYDEKLCQLIEKGDIHPVEIRDIHENQKFFEDVSMVVAATDDVQFNHELSILCQQKNIWFNSATSAEDSSFLFPSAVVRGDLVTGISSSGHAPALTRYVRAQMEDFLPEWYELLERRMKELRNIGEVSLNTQYQRQEFMRQMLSVGLMHEGAISEESVQMVLNNLKMGEKQK